MSAVSLAAKVFESQLLFNFAFLIDYKRIFFRIQGRYENYDVFALDSLGELHGKTTLRYSFLMDEVYTFRNFRTA